MNNNLLEIITKCLLINKNKVCFSKKKQGEWISYSKKDYFDIAENIAFALLKKGIKKGDNVIIASENRPEWNFIDLALLKIGAVSVPVYSTISDKQLKIIIEETEAKIAFVSNKYLYRKIKAISLELNYRIESYSFEDIEAGETIYDLVDLGKANKNHDKLLDIRNSINENDVYTILYTSGTEDYPKGVMLSHKSSLIVINDGLKRTNVQEGYKTILYLPLNNSFGRIINYILQIAGVSIYYINGLSKLKETFKEVKPNFIATAPLFLEKIISESIQTEKADEELENAKKIIENYEYSDGFYKTKEYKLADKKYFNKWKNILGGEMLTILVGGAIVNKNIYNFFKTLKINLINGYGLTEASAVVCMDSFDKITKPAYAGQTITGIEIKISEEGEILAKGGNIMQAYYKHPEITAKTIDNNGWLHTGDLGKIDEDGYLSITGRLKSTFKLTSGEYVYPRNIEKKLKKNNLIENIIIAGLGQEYIVALIVPNLVKLKSLLATKNINFENIEELNSVKDVNEIFNNIIAKYNSILIGKNQRIKKFKLISEKWTIETGELSSSKEIRRNYILEKYKDIIENMYN